MIHSDSKPEGHRVGYAKIAKAFDVSYSYVRNIDIGRVRTTEEIWGEI